MDENATANEPEKLESTNHRKTIWKLSQLTREGADFIVAVPTDGKGEPEALGTQSISSLTHWTQRANELALRMGERLEAGPLLHVSGQNLERQVLLLARGDRAFLIGWPSDASGNLAEKSRKLVASWDS